MAQTATVEKLRSDIDRGRTGQKVRAPVRPPDPAAAPLGADAEAAGTPFSAQHKAHAEHAQEWRAMPEPLFGERERGATWVLVGSAVITGVVLLAAILARA